MMLWLAQRPLCFRETLCKLLLTFEEKLARCVSGSPAYCADICATIGACRRIVVDSAAHVRPSELWVNYSMCYWKSGVGLDVLVELLHPHYYRDQLSQVLQSGQVEPVFVKVWSSSMKSVSTWKFHVREYHSVPYQKY